MTELWRTRRDARVRGWLLSAEVVVRVCCRVLAPALVTRTVRHGRLGSLKVVVEMAAPQRCHRSD